MEDALAIMRSMESRGKICRRTESDGGGGGGVLLLLFLVLFRFLRGDGVAGGFACALVTMAAMSFLLWQV